MASFSGPAGAVTLSKVRTCHPEGQWRHKNTQTTGLHSSLLGPRAKRSIAWRHHMGVGR